MAAPISYKRHCINIAQEGDFAPNLPNVFMNSDEAVDHVECYPFTPESPEAWAELLMGANLYIRNREKATMESGILPRPMFLAGLLNLSRFAYFAMNCALICKLDNGFERVFTLLQGSESIGAPTLGTIQTLYSIAFPDQEVGWFSNSLSIENRLIFDSAQEFGLKRSLALRPCTFSYIVGEPSLSRELSSYIGEFPFEDREPLHIDEQLQTARSSFRAMLSRKEPHLCVLSGVAGSGKKLTIQQLSKEERTQFLLIDLDKRFPDESNLGKFDTVMEELLFFALVKGVIPCFSLKEPESNIQIQYIYEMVKTYRLGIFILTESTQYNAVRDGYVVTCIDYPPLDLEKSHDFWRLFSENYEFSPDINWVHISARYTLTPGQIKAAIRCAAEMAKAQNTLISEKMISEAVLFENTGRMGLVADRIEIVYTWDDILLTDSIKNTLLDVCDRIKYRYTVEIEWSGKFAYGNGVSILLYGPPGTGKTMSAQIIAGELGLPLYRINIANIISKYIGETTKNINTVFDEAKRGNVILFFDEADALFATRTDVNNSNDRHANSESSYLLQKMEEYSGVSILATNLANVMDEAFRRRINYMINIHLPDEALRLAIWKKCIPAKAPLSEDINLKLLADNFDFSGSVIRSAVTQAAYFAAREGIPIEMKHLARAIRLELSKMGKEDRHVLVNYRPYEVIR